MTGEGRNSIDIFMSHAGEDKLDLAMPLAAELERRGLSVWIDQQELAVGDSLNEKIDAGLAMARFGVVVLSHAFFSKRWTRRELDGLVARETVGGKTIILPVWHGLEVEDVVRYSPTLAGKLAVNSSRGVAAVAEEIETAISRLPTSPSVSKPPLGVYAGRSRNDELFITTNYGFQAVGGVARYPSARISWNPHLSIIYTGRRILRIFDIEPLGPKITGTIDGKDNHLEFVRLENSDWFNLFETFGDVVAAQARRRDGSMRAAAEWPLILKPGDRRYVEMQQTYQFVDRNGPCVFPDCETLLQYCATYFQFETHDDGSVQAGNVVLPTRVRSSTGEHLVDVDYAPWVSGVSLQLPAMEDLLEDLGVARMSRLGRLRRRWLNPDT